MAAASQGLFQLYAERGDIVIPQVEAKLKLNMTVPETISFASRAEYLRSLPTFLSAVIEAPDGLNLVNISNETPQVKDRDKPWFKTNTYGRPLGIFLWSADKEDWMNICPHNVDEWLAEVQRAVELSNTSLETSEKAKETAEQHETFATTGSGLTATAKANSAIHLATGSDALLGVRADAPPFLNGHLTSQTFFIDPAAVPRSVYAPGYVVTPWVALTNPLSPDFVVHGFVTLVNDNYPDVLFPCELQCNAAGDSIRLRGYEIYPESVFEVDGFVVPRTVDFMWLLKGVLAP